MNDPDDRTWPFDDGPGEDGLLAWSTGEKSIRESLVNLLLTRPGERLMRPNFGAGVTRYIHQPNDETTRGLLSGDAERAAGRGEPRIKVEAVEAVPDPAEPTQVVLSLRYRRLLDDRTGDLNLRLALDA